MHFKHRSLQFAGKIIYLLKITRMKKLLLPVAVVATLGLAFAAGHKDGSLNMEEAIYMAKLAGNIAVTERGTSTVSAEQLAKELES